jgi:NADH-quinone oxidoreductase subunit J
MLTTLLFYALATVLVGAALGVVLSRNPVRAVLSLVLAFFVSAGLWLLLQAEFLGLVLVLVYVGAVMVLFLFVVMMLDVHLASLKEGFTRYAPLGGAIALLVIAEIVYVVWFKHLGIRLDGWAQDLPEGVSNTAQIGQQLYSVYLLPFELAAVILLVAIIAAIALTLRHRDSLKHQDISAQVAVRREDRVKLVKVTAETQP